MRVVRVHRQDLDEALGRLLEADLVERGRKVSTRGDHGLVPLQGVLPPGVLEGIGHDLGEVGEDELEAREALRAPRQRILRAALREGWSEEAAALLPDRWERLGRVLVLRVPEGLRDREAEVAAMYARELGAEAVLAGEGPVTGMERRPSVRLVWGEGTRTVHREHGVEYSFDAARQMFSKGNVHERRRMGRAVEPGEVVVDMFAGIGYFALPMAVLGSPARVHAVELDPGAHAFLVENVGRNGVGEVVLPLLGDCRDVAPRGVADRVVMGYVGGTDAFLDTAMEVLGEAGGVVHFHDKYGVDQVPGRPVAAVEEAAGEAGRTVRLLGWREVKSYAPAIVHAVVDVEVR